MLTKSIAVTLILSLAAPFSGAQVAVSRRAPIAQPVSEEQIPQADLNTSKRYRDLIELAQNDLWLGYGVGEGYEKGEIHAVNMTDIDAAVYWYTRAEQGTMHGGLYRIGVLLKEQRLLMKDRYGVPRPNPEQGQFYMNEALAKGFDSVHDTCCGRPLPAPAPRAATASTPSKSEDSANGAAMLLGGVFLGALAASLFSDNSSGSRTSSQTTPTRSEPSYTNKTCVIYYEESVPYDPTYPGNARTVQKSRIGASYECP